MCLGIGDDGICELERIDEESVQMFDALCNENEQPSTQDVPVANEITESSISGIYDVIYENISSFLFF